MYAKECKELICEVCKSETIINKNKSDIMGTSKKVSLNTTLSGILVKSEVVKYVSINDEVAVSEKSENGTTDSTLAVTNDKNNLVTSSMEIVIQIF